MEQDNPTPIQSPKFTDVQYIREACRTAGSLLSEGYVCRCKWYDQSRKVIMYTLRHMTNGNTITITASKERFHMMKNGKTIKKLP